MPRTLRLSTAGCAALVAAVAFGASGASGYPGASIRAYKPVADTYVTSARPGANFGQTKLLRVDGSPETTSYLRFRLPKIKPEIESVTLLLHPGSRARGAFAVRLVHEDGWRERRISFRSAPPPSVRYAAAKPVRRGAWNAIDVTPFVDGDGGYISLALTARAGRHLTFWSRESRRGPRLVVRTAEKDDDKEPPSTPSSTG